MRFLNLSLLIATILMTTACNFSGGGSKSSGPGTPPFDLNKAQGIWMADYEAKELRTTNKLESYCSEIRKDPNSTIVNTRLIDSGGNFFLYNPTQPNFEHAKMATIDMVGGLTWTPVWKEQMGTDADSIGSARLEVKEDVLKMIHGNGDKTYVALTYVRSSDAEVRKYFQAQEDCKK